MEQIDRESLVKVLAPINAPLERRLADAESVELGVLLAQMADRYPAQDLRDSMEGYMWDFEQLALKFSLAEVRTALAELRIRAGQKFFPRPDEVAEVIECRREEQIQARRRQREREQRLEMDRERWEWFDNRIRDNGEATVNGQVCRTDEAFAAAMKGILPRSACFLVPQL